MSDHAKARVAAPGRRAHAGALVLIGALLLAAVAASAAAALMARERAAARPLVALVRHPATRSTSAVARFAWSVRVRGARVSCRLDRRRAVACHRARTYRGLRPGRHVFRVTARAGGRRRVVAFRWQVIARVPMPPDRTLPAPTTATRPGTPAPALDAGVARFHRTAIRAAAFPGVTTHAARRAAWIGQGEQAGVIPAWRAGNASVLSLLYKEAPYIHAGNPRSAATGGNVAGVSAAEADRHPEWYLLDAGGARIHNEGYDPYVLVDIGSTSYQEAWAHNVIEQVRRDGWSGVFADDLAVKLYNAAATPAKYPTDAAWRAATRSFLAGVGARLRVAGVRFYVNTSGASSGTAALAVRRDWLQFVDGSMDEGWMRPSVDRGAPLADAVSGAWTRQLAELEDSQAQGRWFLAQLPAPPSDLRAVRYGLASFLLVADGRSSFDVSGAPDFTADLWFPEFDTARALGEPRGGMVTLAGGIRRRDFARGAVLVNPTTSAQSAALGASFSGAEARHITNVTMPATTGLVLLRD